ncbi:MAG: carboxypeptidase regulatory-like domain-containing protein [Bryobacterales bacterium]|nr:carboxypeptidase regulatory-like domain-containing protein [Bryobacterales bacterium]
MTKRKLVGTLLLGALVCAGMAFAQTSDNLRAVEGVVKDSGGSPVNGAIVQLKDTKTLQIRSFITRENGAYMFQGLKKSVAYELKAKFKDRESSPKLLTIFDERQRATIDLEIP